MAPELHHRLFQADGQGGSGQWRAGDYGLVNAREVVEAQKGRIWAENKMDTVPGVTFYFTLPVHCPTATTKEGVGGLLVRLVII